MLDLQFVTVKIGRGVDVVISVRDVDGKWLMANKSADNLLRFLLGSTRC
jgi:hypothetical protein